MKERAYLKCYLCSICNSKRATECSLKLLDKSDSYHRLSLKCQYGTGWSIWKWLMRILLMILAISLTTVVLWVVYSWTMWNIHVLQTPTLRAGVGEQVMLSVVGEGLILLIGIVTAIVRTQISFETVGGSLFGEDTR